MYFLQGEGRGGSSSSSSIPTGDTVQHQMSWPLFLQHTMRVYGTFFVAAPPVCALVPHSKTKPCEKNKTAIRRCKLVVYCRLSLHLHGPRATSRPRDRKGAEFAQFQSSGENSEPEFARGCGPRPQLGKPFLRLWAGPRPELLTATVPIWPQRHLSPRRHKSAEFANFGAPVRIRSPDSPVVAVHDSTRPRTTAHGRNLAGPRPELTALRNVLLPAPGLGCIICINTKYNKIRIIHNTTDVPVYY